MYLIDSLLWTHFWRIKTKLLSCWMVWFDLIWFDAIIFLDEFNFEFDDNKWKMDIESTSKRQTAYTRVPNANSIRIEWKWKSEATIGPCPFMKLLQESLCVYTYDIIALVVFVFPPFCLQTFVLSLLVIFLLSCLLCYFLVFCCPSYLFHFLYYSFSVYWARCGSFHSFVRTYAYIYIRTV